MTTVFQKTVSNTYSKPHPSNPTDPPADKGNIYPPFHPPIIQVYRGKYTTSPSSCQTSSRSSTSSGFTKVYDRKSHASVAKKVFVFDLDETIGCFTELYTLWCFILRNYTIPTNNDYEIQTLFNELLDLFPEFLRKHILKILKYIHEQREKGRCHRVYLYTNNQCEYIQWVKHIVVYLDWKITEGKSTLFEKPICAFKIGNTVVEKRRTRHDKTWSDFIACSLLPRKTEICFLDDKQYKQMRNDRVYYIQPPPYYHSLPHQVIYERFCASPIHQRLTPNNHQPPLSHPFHYAEVSKWKIMTAEEHQTIYAKWMYYIREFLMSSLRSQTRKIRCRIGRFTRKKRNGRVRDGV